MFYSSKEKALVTLEEYVSRMAENQKYIYYISGESVERIEKLPQIEMVMDRGYEILYLTDEVDEFAIQMLMKYQDKEFKSVANGDLGLDEEETKEETEDAENKELFDYIKETLNGTVKAVKASKRLKSYPVCLSAEGALSIEMEKILKMMPNSQDVKADKVLEVNVNHEIFSTLKNLFETDKDKLKLYVNLLYNQALLIEGLPVSDPVEFTNNICKLMK